MMSEILTNWERSHYQPGGGDPFLFYVIYGEIDLNAALSSQKYRVEDTPEELEIMTYGPTVHPETVDSFREGYLWEQLQKSAPEFAKKIGTATSCMVLRGTFPDPSTLNYLRDTVGLITHFLDHGGICVYDPQMFEWWSPEKWKERIFDPASAVPRHHTIILVSDNPDGTVWIHTRGLRKYGRPDISIPSVTPATKEGSVDLCNRFIELQAFGGIIPEGQEIQMESLPQGLKCHHRGNLDDPDFNNVHISIE